MSTAVEEPPKAKAKPKGSERYFGRAMKRVEDPRLLKGIATYVDDLKLPSMLHAEFVRSPHAHAKINSINTDSAKKLRGVVGIFAGADVNGKLGTIPCATPLPGGKTPGHTVLPMIASTSLGTRLRLSSPRPERSRGTHLTL
jgi:carbon-monoxide dehydrogenase large subunit